MFDLQEYLNRYRADPDENAAAGDPRGLYFKLIPETNFQQGFQQVQGERWDRLLRTAVERIIRRQRSRPLQHAFEVLLSIVSSAAARESGLGPGGVTSTVPLLDDLRDDLLDVDDWLIIAAVVTFFCQDTAEAQLPAESLSALLNDPRLLTNLARFAAPSPLQYDRMIERGHQAEQRVSEAVLVLNQKAQEYDAAIRRAREESIFKSATLLWQEKAWRHTAGYAAGFVVVILTLGALAWFMYDHAGAFLAAMPRNPTTGEFTYLAVVIVGLLFVALAWVFRMLGRFVLDNFMLASDARQRQMILQTFLTLVGTPEAQMKDGERVLILNAIFRPAPGQGSDDPAPSSLADLMKGALPGATATEKK